VKRMREKRNGAGSPRSRRAAAAALLLPLALNAAPPAASPAAPPGPFRVTSAVELSLVNLDVVVTGKGDEPIHGLSAADFEVRHDGKLVTITNFREERPAARPPAPAGSAPPAAAPPPAPAGAPPAEASEAPRPRRHVVLFVDRLALPDQRERREFFDALRGFLRKGLGPGDDAMVVAWDRSVRTVQRFTSDLGELDRALAAAEKGAIRTPTEQAEIDRLASDTAWFQMVGQGDAGPSRRMDAQEAYREVKGKTSALRGLIAMMAGMEGRKVLVVASRRLSRRAGYEYGAVVDARPLLEAVASAANAAGVTLHTIYSTAWEFEGPTVAAPRVTFPRAASPVNTG
jgi:VWFA-related protein